LAPSKFAKVARRFTEMIVDARQPMRAIQPLRVAIAKLRTSPDQITPIHADYIQVCLCAKNYKAALPMIEDDAVDVDPSTTGMQPRDLLRFFYYSGLVFVGLKEFRKALEYFKLAVTAPAFAVSAVMLEAYKKFVLVALMVHGSLPPPPKYVSSMVQRALKGACAPYHELATAYASGSSDELHKVGIHHAAVFQQDKNMGLVKQTIASLYRRNIMRNTQTYLTISLADIADAVKLPNPKEAEKRILRMIEAGELFATISQKNGMVSFQDDPEKYDTSKTLAIIDTNMHKIMMLSQKLRKVDESITALPAYIQKTAMHERAGGRGAGWGGAEDFMDEALGAERGAGPHM